MNDGQWHLVALTRSGTTLKAYLDGQEGTIVDTDPSVMSPDTTLPLLLGTSTVPRSYSGLLDEIEIFHPALVGSEIQAIYNARSAGKCKGTSITGFSPSNGGNSGQVTLSLFGRGIPLNSTENVYHVIGHTSG